MALCAAIAALATAISCGSDFACARALVTQDACRHSSIDFRSCQAEKCLVASRAGGMVQPVLEGGSRHPFHPPGPPRRGLERLCEVLRLRTTLPAWNSMMLTVLT